MTDLTKRRAIRSDAIRKAANGEACTWPGCGAMDGTVICAHSNLSVHGKGRGIKSDDVFVAFLCSTHHRMLDESHISKNEKEWNFMRAMSNTIRILWDRGIIGEI